MSEEMVTLKQALIHRDENFKQRNGIVIEQTVRGNSILFKLELDPSRLFYVESEHPIEVLSGQFKLRVTEIWEVRAGRLYSKTVYDESKCGYLISVENDIEVIKGWAREPKPVFREILPVAVAIYEHIGPKGNTVKKFVRIDEDGIKEDKAFILIGIKENFQVINDGVGCDFENSYSVRDMDTGKWTEGFSPSLMDHAIQWHKNKIKK